MSKYETTGGEISRADTYAKIIALLRETQDQCAVMAHLHNTEGNDMDKLLARGWLGVSEIMSKLVHQITQLAMNRPTGIIQ